MKTLSDSYFTWGVGLMALLPLTLTTRFSFRFVGRPGSYVYVFDGYRMEEASRAPGIRAWLAVCRFPSP